MGPGLLQLTGPLKLCREPVVAFHEKAGAATDLVGLRDSFLRRQGCQNLRCMVP
jgi:hypothetical protein